MCSAGPPRRSPTCSVPRPPRSTAGRLARALRAEEHTSEPTEAARRATLDRFVAAFENADADALAELLRKDAVLEMPPFLTWFAGGDTVWEFFTTRIITAPGLFRMVP